MQIFLGAEIEGPVTAKWYKLQKKYSNALCAISSVSYGMELERIAVISIIMRSKFYENDGYRERKHYSKKTKEADIRLRIDYGKFLTADEHLRKEIYIAHILEAIRIAGEKAGKNFDLHRLLLDVEKLLNES